MKILTPLLAFLTSSFLLASTGCPKREDPPVNAQPHPATPGSPAEKAPPAALPIANDPKAPAGGPSIERPAGEPSTGRPPGGAPVAELTAQQQACVDRWLKERNLDEYGNPAGTMYMGGTPLFDESTGQMKNRFEFIFNKQPDARKGCVAP
jgi:hypothetical protein